MKRPGLKAALSLAVGGHKAVDPEPAGPTIPTVGRPPVRVGRRQIAGWLAQEVARQVHLIAFEAETTVHALLTEALNELFTKYGKPPIA
jgi:hypothetical protein